LVVKVPQETPRQWYTTKQAKIGAGHMRENYINCVPLILLPFLLRLTRVICLIMFVRSTRPCTPKSNVSGISAVLFFFPLHFSLSSLSLRTLNDVGIHSQVEKILECYTRSPVSFFLPYHQQPVPTFSCCFGLKTFSLFIIISTINHHHDVVQLLSKCV
jgi:hypothetical protein